jgi:hypothetical protein
MSKEMAAIATSHARELGVPLCDEETGERPPRLDRVRWIAEMMARDEYDDDARSACAEEWRMTPGSVEQLTDRAYVHMQLIGDKTLTKRLIHLRLEAIQAENGSDRVAALKYLGELVGIGERAAPGDSPRLNTANPDAREWLVAALANPNTHMRQLVNEAIDRARDKCLGLHALICEKYEVDNAK